MLTFYSSSLGVPTGSPVEAVLRVLLLILSRILGKVVFTELTYCLKTYYRFFLRVIMLELNRILRRGSNT